MKLQYLEKVNELLKAVAHGARTLRAFRSHLEGAHFELVLVHPMRGTDARAILSPEEVAPLLDEMQADLEADLAELKALLGEPVTVEEVLDIVPSVPDPVGAPTSPRRSSRPSHLPLPEGVRFASRRLADETHLLQRYAAGRS